MELTRLKRLFRGLSPTFTIFTGLFSVLILTCLSLHMTAGSALAEDGYGKVTRLRHWSYPNYTRIVVDLTKRSGYKPHLLKQDPSINKPRRLYIDIFDSRLSERVSKSTAINDGLLKAARVGQYNKDTVRVVFDIESIEEYKVFSLSEPSRLVIDIKGKRKAEAAGVSESKRPVPTPTAPVMSQKEATRLTKQLGLKVKSIVIDPGHGGKDPGAVGKRSLKEKDIVLKLSKRLQSSLRGKLKGTKVSLTRNKDKFIPLEQRTAIAKSKNADLFISVHVNAAKNKNAKGIETYYLGMSRDEKSRRLAARENATSTKAVSDLEFILQDLIMTAKANDSALLASVVQKRLVTHMKKKYKGIKDLGTKTAPFYVLVSADMPSILIEISFISNPTEWKRLKSDKYINELVAGITDGVLKYLKEAGFSN